MKKRIFKMGLKFKTKVDTRLGDSNDAMSLLKTAINNGQARLAMEILIDVLDGIVEVLEKNEAPQETQVKANTTDAVSSSPELKNEDLGLVAEKNKESANYARKKVAPQKNTSAKAPEVKEEI
jgi:hypothetical protein